MLEAIIWCGAAFLASSGIYVGCLLLACETRGRNPDLGSEPHRALPLKQQLLAFPLRIDYNPHQSRS